MTAVELSYGFKRPAETELPSVEGSWEKERVDGTTDGRKDSEIAVPQQTWNTAEKADDEPTNTLDNQTDAPSHSRRTDATAWHPGGRRTQHGINPELP